MTLAQGDEMTRQQVMALMACMLSTAHVDGVSPQELALMKTFYEQCGVADLPPFAENEGAYGDPVELAAQCANDPEFAVQLVLMSFMTAYADGHLTDGERVHVVAIAARAGLSDARTNELLLHVKDTLIGAIAMLPDAESVARIAKSL
jgi:tellurite resistance protein